MNVWHTTKWIARSTSRVLLKITEWSLKVGLYATSTMPLMTRIPSALIIQSGLQIVHFTQYMIEPQPDTVPLLL